jgi:hypothetical protein
MKRWLLGFAVVSFIFASAGFSEEAKMEMKKDVKPAHMMKAKCPHMAMADVQSEGICRVPVIVRLIEGKIVVEPDPAVLYWGMGAVFEVDAQEGEKVTLVFEQDPFKEKHQPAEYSITGSGKIKTDKSFRPERLGEPGKTLAERLERKREFKYSVKWSGGRAVKPIEIDPKLDLVDP